jgi:hypothetical protein
MRWARAFGFNRIESIDQLAIVSHDSAGRKRRPAGPPSDSPYAAKQLKRRPAGRPAGQYQTTSANHYRLRRPAAAPPRRFTHLAVPLPGRACCCRASARRSHDGRGPPR